MSLSPELYLEEKISHQTEVKALTTEERDAQVLARLGKKSVLKVRQSTIKAESCI